MIGKMKPRKLGLFLLPLFFYLPGFVFAETLILKSGRRIQAKILEKTDRYIKVEIDGAPVYYELKYISSIKQGNEPANSAGLESLRDVSSCFEKSIEYILAGNLQAAKTEMNQGLKINPDDANVLGGLEIINGLEKGLIGKDYAIDFFKGIYYIITKQPGLAITELERAAQLSPKEADVYYHLGVSYYSLGKLKEAAENFKKSLEIRPEDAEVCFDLAVIYFSLDSYQESFNYAKEAVELEPNSGDAYYLLGFASRALKENTTARGYLIKAKELLQDQGEPQKIKDIEQALKELPE